MTSASFWYLFQETGEPLYYLLYCETLALEDMEEKSA